MVRKTQQARQLQTIRRVLPPLWTGLRTEPHLREREFLQVPVVVPDGQEDVITSVLEQFAAARCPVFPAVLKRLRPEGPVRSPSPCGLDWHWAYPPMCRDSAPCWTRWTRTWLRGRADLPDQDSAWHLRRSERCIHRAAEFAAVRRSVTPSASSAATCRRVSGCDRCGSPRTAARTAELTYTRTPAATLRRGLRQTRRLPVPAGR